MFTSVLSFTHSETKFDVSKTTLCRQVLKAIKHQSSANTACFLMGWHGMDGGRMECQGLVGLPMDRYVEDPDFTDEFYSKSV